mmetsp:Transcript_51916/g.118360  ORF Transcript_51916/g.118360 Transcript_51916/m.118360 type:complete len:298 (+) Transcript_51916:1005-1898(+)
MQIVQPIDNILGHNRDLLVLQLLHHVGQAGGKGVPYDGDAIAKLRSTIVVHELCVPQPADDPQLGQGGLDPFLLLRRGPPHLILGLCHHASPYPAFRRGNTHAVLPGPAGHAPESGRCAGLPRPGAPVVLVLPTLAQREALQTHGGPGPLPVQPLQRTTQQQQIVDLITEFALLHLHITTRHKGHRTRRNKSRAQRPGQLGPQPFDLQLGRAVFLLRLDQPPLVSVLDVGQGLVRGGRALLGHSHAAQELVCHPLLRPNSCPGHHNLLSKGLDHIDHIHNFIRVHFLKLVQGAEETL